ncbi:MAG: helix-turn-helix domain-containing protein [Enhygromyxa sp.]
MTAAAQTLGANLRRYRQVHGLSQAALAERAGLSRVGYRDIELGKAEPRAATLASIAQALGVRVPDLLAPVRTLSHVRFRADKRMSLRANILTDIARWLDDYADLEQLLDARIAWKLARVAKRAQSLAPGPERGETVARLARTALGLDQRNHQDTVRDVCGLLEDNGVKVLTADVKSEGFFGLSVGPEDDGPAVFVNIWDRISVERWIFTAIHELGHLLMHPGAFDVDQAEEDSLEERDADNFASHFLMPRALFEKEWDEARGLALIDRVFKVKRIFRVSWQTVLWRVAAPLPSGQRRRVWTSFTDAYERRTGRILGRTDEPDPLAPDTFLAGRPVPRAADEPSRLDADDFREDRLARLVREAVESSVISMSRAAEILGLPLKDMRAVARSWVD